LRQKASRLIGVDISPRMLEKAREKGLYDELVEMELVDFLRSHEGTFDRIVASDVLNYFGDLAPLLEHAANALLPEGTLAFSVECGDPGLGFTLGPHGRYGHDKDYVIDLMERAGLHLQKVEGVVLRYEFGKAVNAFLIAATKPGASVQVNLGSGFLQSGAPS
jgi:predicted TPR repeat methyltransferase